MTEHREFSEEERSEYAQKGWALPDGSYPMPDCDAVERAIESYERAPESHRHDLAALIVRRNEELGCGHDLSGLKKEAAHAPEHEEHEEQHDTGE